MKVLNIMILSFTGLLMTGLVEAVEINIDTATDASGKSIRSNTVNEGRVVINGKVIKGSSRKMTAKEQKALNEELTRQGLQIEDDMADMEKGLEGMFDE